MDERTFDKLVHYPPDEDPILKWYDSRYEAVFVAFHPFFKIEGMSPAEYRHGPNIIDASTIKVPMNEFIESLMAETADVDERRESFDADWLKKAKTVTWRTVASACGIKDDLALNRALLTSVLALKQRFSNEIDAKRLNNWCEQNDVFMPTTGEIQPPLISAMGGLFIKLRCDEIWLGDEFSDDRVAIPVSKFLRNEIGPGFSVKNIFDGRYRALVTVDWDSFFTLFCGPRNLLEEIVEQNDLEGFFGDEQTAHHWWFSGE